MLKKKKRMLIWGNSVLVDGMDTLWGHTGSIQEMPLVKKALRKGAERKHPLKRMLALLNSRIKQIIKARRRTSES